MVIHLPGGDFFLIFDIFFSQKFQYFSNQKKIKEKNKKICSAARVAIVLATRRTGNKLFLRVACLMNTVEVILYALGLNNKCSLLVLLYT